MDLSSLNLLNVLRQAEPSLASEGQPVLNRLYFRMIPPYLVSRCEPSSALLVDPCMGNKLTYTCAIGASALAR